MTITITIAAPADLASIISNDPRACDHLAHLYSPFVHPTMGVRYKCAGIATAVGSSSQFAGSVAIVETKSPGSLVLPRYFGDQLTRDEAFNKGAERALDHAAGIIAARIVEGLDTPEEEALFNRASREASDDHEAREMARHGGEFPRGEFAF